MHYRQEQHGAIQNQTHLKEIEDHRCAIYLSKANAAWARGEAGANETAHWLGLIPSDSKCAAEASQLSADVRSRLTELDKREWDLQYEKYNREIRLREQRQDSELYLKEEKPTDRDNYKYKRIDY